MVSSNVLALGELRSAREPRGPRHPFPPLVDLTEGEDASRPTWGDLIRHEPRLAALHAETMRVRSTGNPNFCANRVWIRDFKPRIECLVGWFAERNDPMLTTSAAYDLAYQMCYAPLPACRDCLCA